MVSTKTNYDEFGPVEAAHRAYLEAASGNRDRSLLWKVTRHHATFFGALGLLVLLALLPAAGLLCGWFK